MVFRTLLILTLVFGIAAVLHQQFTDRAAAFSPPAGPTPDAAAALRSLSGVARPTKPWIDDFAGFSASHPGRWIVGRCAAAVSVATGSRAIRTERCGAGRLCHRT